MSKYPTIFLISFIAFMGCEDIKGPMGPAGQDGVANMHIEIIQLTPDNTQFVDFDNYGSGTSGYLTYQHETSYLPSSVLDSGSVKVELSADNGETWSSLPYLLYDGDSDGVNYVYNCEYSYTEGSVGISWWCSFDRTAQDWLNIENLWAVNYKITILTP